MYFEDSELSEDLLAIRTAIQKAAFAREGNCLELLKLLRVLEEGHREIHDGAFRASLPDSRQDLREFLLTIEASGNWPYIHRLHIRQLLANLTESESNSENY